MKGGFSRKNKKGLGGALSGGLLGQLSQESGKTISNADSCLLYTSPSPRDLSTSRMPSSA